MAEPGAKVSRSDEAAARPARVRTPARRLWSDSVHALRVWRVWMFLGVQDIKARFRRSAIGPLWILFNMSLFVIGAGLLYGVLINQPMRVLLPYLVTGFTLWAFIVTSLTESAWAFVNAEGYIKQFCYPKQIYLLRTLVANTIILLISLTAVVPVQLYFRSFSLIGWLLAIPGLLLLFLAVLGHITVCAYLGVCFRDLPHAANGALQVAFFVTPVMFPARMLLERHLAWIYELNPFYYLLEIARRPILEGRPADPQIYAFAGIYVLLVWLLAWQVARSLDSRVVILL
ncbi:MAG: ABC transporter permease [Acidobacteriia bacterium]|nr:ABC transporter permease [Terriglobia bacterium]